MVDFKDGNQARPISTVLQSRCWRARPRTLRFGPMKPVGSPDRATRREAYAVQLRQDNKLGTLYNLVGLQTMLKHGAPASDFSGTIPGGERRIRPGSRAAPHLLPQLAEAARRQPAAARRSGLRFAGLFTGCEGYVESPASASWPAFAPQPTARAAAAPPPPSTRSAACQPHHGGHIEDGRCRAALVQR